MRRVPVPPRPDWRERVEAQGLVWHTASGAPYWREDAAYVLSPSEIAELEAAGRALYGLFLEAGDYVVERRLFDRFAIPEAVWDLVAQAWRREPPALNYGRFDLGYDGRGPPKLFEFNCDTPTALLEAGPVQGAWREDVAPSLRQFNRLAEALDAKWADLAPLVPERRVHFACARAGGAEDAVTTAFMMDRAADAGLEVEALFMSDVGRRDGAFVDLAGAEIRALYKLYPWEWIVSEPFAVHLAETADRTVWIEPIWKMIWSNKAILPILWDLFPRHPNLLWASRDGPKAEDHVEKPILAREGANVRIVEQGRVVAESDGRHHRTPTIHQGLYRLPDFDGRRPVFGLWMVDGEPVGLGVREDGLITSNLARFAPHLVDAGA